MFFTVHNAVGCCEYLRLISHSYPCSAADVFAFIRLNRHLSEKLFTRNNSLIRILNNRLN